MHNRVFDYGRLITNLLATGQGYLAGNYLSLAMGLIVAALTLFLFLFGKRIWHWTFRGFGTSAADDKTYSSVQFYERLISLMEQRGLSRDKHLTPLEFANTLKSNDALLITRAYNRVRFGGQRLSAIEKKEVERALFALEATEKQG